MSLASIIRQRREQLGLTQDQLALQVGISKPYLSNIETGKAKNPASDGVLSSLERGLSLPAGTLTRVANLVRTPIDVRQEHEMLQAELQQLRGILRELLASPAPEPADRSRLLKLAEDLGQARDRSEISAGAVVPVINSPAEGYPRHFTGLDYPAVAAREYIRCPDLHDGQAFAVRVADETMASRYGRGDIVVFSPATAPAGGDDCFVRFTGQGETTFRRLQIGEDGAICLQPLNSEFPGQTYRSDQIDGIWPAVLRIERLARPSGE